MHIVALETHARNRHVSEVCAVILHIYTFVAVFCPIEIYVVNIERKASIEVV